MSLLSRARRAFQRTGAIGFLKLGIHNLRIVLGGTAGQHRYINDDAWDRMYGVDTAGSVAIEELTAPEDGKPGAVRYEPTPPECFAYLLEEARIGDVSDYTFVDIGSGKGRVLLLAALAGFKRAIGVEFGEELHVIACANIEAMKERIAPAAALSIQADGRSYRFPHEPTVCFLNNPFGPEAVASLLDRIETSLGDCPRQFIVIYYHSNHAEELGRRTVWRPVSSGAWRDDSHHFAIFKFDRAEAEGHAIEGEITSCPQHQE